MILGGMSNIPQDSSPFEILKEIWPSKSAGTRSGEVGLRPPGGLGQIQNEGGSGRRARGNLLPLTRPCASLPIEAAYPAPANHCLEALQACGG
jgi:hypothetical protein